MRWSLFLLLLSIGCGEEVPPGKCQSGKKEIDGVCRLSCARDVQCLLSEVCTDGACMPMADPQLPVIRLFAADPSTVQPGGGTQIDYVVLFADSVDMVGDGVEGTVNVLGQTDRLAGTVEVSPLQKSIDVTLTARRNNGSTATDQLTIRVSDPNLPAIDYFTADPIVVSPGDFTELSWGTTNAVTARITGGEGPYEDLPVTGNISVSVQ